MSKITKNKLFRAAAGALGSQLLSGLNVGGVKIDMLFQLDEKKITNRIQRDYMYEVIFPDIGRLPGYEVGRYVIDVSLGDYSFNDLNTMRWGAYTKNFAGNMTAEAPVFSFLKAAPDFVAEYMYQWRDLIVDENGYYSAKNKYSKNIYIKLYDVDGIETGQYIYQDCFPKNLPKFKMSQNSESYVRYDIEFAVDRILYK